jgi:WS/DGAT/MGAT family acyltransferase
VATTRPAEAALAFARAARDATDLVETRLEGAPRSPYNAPLTPTRTYAWTRVPLDAVRAVKDRAGATVNDVVLAGVTGALRRHLLRDGHAVDGLVLKAMVPVSTRAEEEHGALGNRITSVYAPLPVHVADPRERLAAVMRGMAETKAVRPVGRGEAVVAAGDLAPPQVMGLVARQMASPRLFNLTVTNIPGPPVPLYVLGRRLADVFPLVPLVREHGLGIAVMSYEGALDFGLLACADTVPDLGDLADDLAASLAELPGWTRAQTRRFARTAPFRGAIADAGAVIRRRHVRSSRPCRFRPRPALTLPHPRRRPSACSAAGSRWRSRSSRSWRSCAGWAATATATATRTPRRSPCSTRSTTRRSA